MPVIRIGAENDFAAGEMVRRSLLGRHVAILRREDDSWIASEANCRHQNADLTAGACEGDIVTCPRHGWRYNLATGECLTEPWARLRTFQIWTDNESVYLDTTPLDSAPFSTQPTSE